MNILLAAGLLLTTATQFRIPGMPLGPGELCLVLWLLLAAGRALTSPTHAAGSAFSKLFLFWAVFALAQALGTLTGMVIGDKHDSGLFLHDLLAYPLMAALSCLGAVQPAARWQMNRVASIVVALGGASMLVLLAAGNGLVDIPMIDPWFGDRFRGWSNNPNQLAMLCFILLFLALHVVETADRPYQRIMAMACLIPAFIVGRLTKTDTFTFALIAAVPLFLFMTLRSWRGSPAHARSLRSTFAGILAIGLPVMLLAMAPLLVSLSGGPQTLASGLTKNDGKEAASETKLRLELWHEAIDRGLEAKLLGLGPGPHLPIPTSIAIARQTELGLDTGDHPQVNDTPNFEAHNTFLDLFAQGGAIAVLALTWIVTAAFVVTWKMRRAGLAALLCGVGVFAMTNLIVRLPMVWFVLVLGLICADGLGVVPNVPRWALTRLKAKEVQL